VDDALVPGSRDEVHRDEPRRRPSRGLSENGRRGSVLRAATGRVRGGLGAEERDVVRALGDRERQLGRGVEGVADRLVASSVVRGPVDQRTRPQVGLLVRLREPFHTGPQGLRLRRHRLPLFPVVRTARRRRDQSGGHGDHDAGDRAGARGG
jgi:hypothetical protein